MGPVWIRVAFEAGPDYAAGMLTFAIRLLLWLGLLAVLTFFWVSVLDAGEDGMQESLRRNVADLKHAVFGRPEL